VRRGKQKEVAKAIDEKKIGGERSNYGSYEFWNASNKIFFCQAMLRFESNSQTTFVDGRNY
jgi:hypothetical protein